MTKLKEKYGYGSKRYSVKEAVLAQCYDQRDDRIDQLNASLDKTHNLLATLLEVLSETKIINDLLIEEILDEFEVDNNKE